MIHFLTFGSYAPDWLLNHQYSITNHSESILKSEIMSILMIIFVVVFFLSDLLRNILKCNCDDSVFTWCDIMQQCTTRMGSKVMPLANFHRNCWREDKTHALYVFSILSPFNRCINCICRHNISREIYFCTNPTHRRLSKMVGRSVENEIEIR